MPEIKFSADKSDRWLERVAKRVAALTPEDFALYERLSSVRLEGRKLDPRESKDLFELGKRL